MFCIVLWFVLREVVCSSEFGDGWLVGLPVHCLLSPSFHTTQSAVNPLYPGTLRDLGTTMKTPKFLLRIAHATKKLQERSSTRMHRTGTTIRHGSRNLSKGAWLLLRFVERSSDALPPLKSAAAGVSFIIEAIEVCYGCSRCLYWILTDILLLFGIENKGE